MVMIVTMTPMVVVTVVQVLGCRVDLDRDDFDGRLRDAGRTVAFAARDTRPSGFDAEHELGMKCRTPAESLSRPRFAPRSPRHSGFLSDAAAPRPTEALASATASPVTTAVAADGVIDGASGDAPDTNVDQSVGASADDPDNSSRESVRTRGRDCSTQTPWQLRPAGFASVDFPFASHKIHGYLDAGRRLNLTPERTDGAELAKTATAYDGLRSGALFNDIGRQARRGSSVCS